MTSKAVVIGGCLAFVATVAWMAKRSYRKLGENLPPRVMCTDRIHAGQQAFTEVFHKGGMAFAVLGTGSMAPYIPAAKPGEDPTKTTVAYATTKPNAVFEDVKEGDLVIYAPEFDPFAYYLHVAALETGDGFIMSGLNNSRSESWARVRKSNFKGIATKVYIWE